MAAPTLHSTRSGVLPRLHNCFHQLKCLTDNSRRCFISTCFTPQRHTTTFIPSHLAPPSPITLTSHHHLTSCLVCFSFHTPRTCALTAVKPNSCLYHYQATCYAHKSTPSGKAAVTEPGLSRLPEEEEKEGVNIRMLKFFGRMTGFYSRKAILIRSAMKLYADSIDNLDYEEFFRVCSLPDTLQSWFLVAHLHVWFLMVRLKREGSDGQYLIKQVVALFWNDVESRMREIGVYQSRAASQSLRELLQQFYGISLAYEEGLLCNDKILASALWRNIVFDKERDTDPVMLAKMVDYIRRQVLHMDCLDSNRMIDAGSISLLPLSHQKKIMS